MSISRTVDGLVCDVCGSDRAGYLCSDCQEIVCSCSDHDCPVRQEEEEQARWEYEQEEFERQQEYERQQFYGER